MEGSLCRPLPIMRRNVRISPPLVPFSARFRSFSFSFASFSFSFASFSRRFSSSFSVDRSLLPLSAERLQARIRLCGATQRK